MPYPVHHIDPHWVLESEQLGTKEKFWFRAPAIIETNGEPFHKAEWLFKYPTAGTGQHWAEKIAYELACRMKILAPRVELVELDGEKGSATENFTQEGYDLFHGNQILAGFDSGYAPHQRFRQNDHTIGRIFDALGILFVDGDEAQRAKEKLAGYLLLDALICNVDRHHENWGVLRKQTEDGWRGRIAPSFDHASSLGRELQDSGTKQNRERYLHELGIAKYLERGRGPIFVDGTGKHGPSPLRLIERSLEIDELAPFFQAALPKLNHFTAEDFETIVQEIPQSWMSDLARDFVCSLLNESLSQLKELS